jgi:hypothetical protein
VTGVPVGRPSGLHEPEQEFDVFTPLRRPEQDGPAVTDAASSRSYPDFSGGDAGGYATRYSNSPAAGAPQGGNGANGGAGANGDNGNYGDEAALGDNGTYQDGEPAPSTGGDFNGLPRRVRQANLAPQLRASAAAAAGSASAAVPPASAASLADMRNTLSAMQRGWQQGRSETQSDTED